MIRKILILILGAQLLTACGCEQVDTGYRGIKTSFGEIVGEPLEEGLHFYNPFTSGIKEISVREEKWEHEAASFTRDTQNAKISVAMTYYPDPTKIGEIYRTLGADWVEKTITPIALQAVKDVVGQYAADDLVGKREEARMKAQEHVVNAMKARNVIVTTLSFTNLDFDDAYEKAVEDKVKAVQKAAEAKNKTVEVEENAKQQVIAAKAEAESMTIRSQALSQNKGLVEYEAVQKWDGKMPQYMLGNGAMPFVSIGSAK